MRNKFVLGVLLVFLASPAFAQAPRAEISGGYSFLRDQDLNMNFNGWVGSVTGNFNRWFGVEGEAGGNYKTTQVLGSDINMSVHSFVAGPRFTARTGEGLEITPFAHVLVGAAHGTASFLGTGASTTNALFQPGGGIDYWLRPKVGIRFGGDYRRLFAEGGGANEFRFHIGVILGLGRL
jgi:outer membrane protein with beta-barrel domain